MLKKILLIILFIGVTAGVAFLLYRFFFAPAPTGPGVTPPTELPGGGGLPTAGPGTGGQPGETPGGGLPPSPTGPGTEPDTATGGRELGEPGTVVRQPAPTSGGLNYYDNSDGRFYRVNGRGQTERLSERAFPSVTASAWSGDGNKAVLAFPDGTKIVYDFIAETQVSIPKHWEDFAFSGDGETIVGKSMGIDPANRWLISFAADGTGAQLIEPLGENGDKVTVSVSPDASIVAFSDTGDPVGFDARDLLPIGQDRQNLAAMRVEGFGFIPRWSPGGRRMIYSSAAAADGYLPALWAVRADGTDVGGGRVKLNVSTWADKCTFGSDDVAYCAEPIGLPQGAGLQRNIADTLTDRVVRIDLASGSIRNVTPPGFAATVRTMKLSDDGLSLFVVDADGQLTNVPLP